MRDVYVQALWQELLGDLQEDMTPEVAAALHAEAHAMTRALSALNRAIAACKSRQHTAGPADAAISTGALHVDAVAHTDDGPGNASSGAMHASIARSEADATIHTNLPGDKLANTAHGQKLAGREQQAPTLLGSESEVKSTAQAALPNAILAAETTSASSAGAVGNAGRLTGSQQTAPRGTSTHVDATSHRPDPVATAEGSLQQPPVQSGSVLGSLHILGSADAGFQLGQQHLMVQDVEELLQPSASTRAGGLPRSPVNGGTGHGAQSESPARPRTTPHSQHTPLNSLSSGGRACGMSGVPGGDLPGCIPDTPSGSEGPGGQPQPSPTTMMRTVRSVLPNGSYHHHDCILRSFSGA